MGRSREFIFAIIVEEIEVCVLAVPYDFTDKGSYCGALLFDSVIIYVITHIGKHLTDDIKFNVSEVVLLNDSFELRQAFSQSFTLLVKFIDLFNNVFFGITSLGSS